jgi:hypothetical protein
MLALAATAPAGLAYAILDYSLVIRLLILLGLAQMPLIAWAAALAWRAGFRPARFLLLAFALAPGTATYALRALGLLASNLATDHAIELGAAAEAVLPSFALAASTAPQHGVVETNAGLNRLSLGVNLTPVSVQRLRAEFVQFGVFFGNANGPRIEALDGFDSFLTQASVPPTSIPRLRVRLCWCRAPSSACSAGASSRRRMRVLGDAAGFRRAR